MAYTFCRIGGDAPGPALLQMASRVVDQLVRGAQWIDIEAGWTYWSHSGKSLSPSARPLLRDADACLYGCVRPRPSVRGYQNPLVQICKWFGVSQRLNLLELTSPISSQFDRETSPESPRTLLAILRLTDSESHAGLEQRAKRANPTPALLGAARERDGEISTSTRSISRKDCRWLCRSAFQVAAEHGLPRIRALHRSALYPHTDGLFLEEFRRAAFQHPAVHAFEENALSALMRLASIPNSAMEPPGELWLGIDPLLDAIVAVASVHAEGGPACATAELGPHFALFHPQSVPDLLALPTPLPESAQESPTPSSFSLEGGHHPGSYLQAAALMLEWVGEKQTALRLRRSLIQNPWPCAGHLPQGDILCSDPLREEFLEHYVQSVLAAL